MILLASSSARRKEILSFFSIPFETVSPPFDEDSIAPTLTPQDYVLAIAEGKAHSIDSNRPILTADTTVYFQGEFLGKPKNYEAAKECLSMLSGQTHQVYTGVAVKFKGNTYTSFEKSDVEFHSYSTLEIENYIRGIHVFDKAGAYAIQGKGGLIVKAIHGCYYNVMGLPLKALQETLLKAADIDLWNYLD